MDWTTIVLTVLTTAFGGCNILQLVNNRALKKKMEAEGDQEQIKSLQMVIEGNVQEITRLQKAYGDLQDKYFALANELMELKKIISK